MPEPEVPEPEQAAQPTSPNPTTLFSRADRLWVFGLVAVAAIGWIVVTETAAQDRRLTITGQVIIKADSDYTTNAAPTDWPILITENSDGTFSCTGNADYADITAGSPVTVYTKGAVFVGASLGKGTADTIDATTCTLPFTVNDLVVGHDYEIEVSERGRAKIDGEAVENGITNVELTLD